MDVLTSPVSDCIISLMMFSKSGCPSMLPPPLPWLACRRSAGEFVSAYTLTKWVNNLPLLNVLPKLSANVAIESITF